MSEIPSEDDIFELINLKNDTNAVSQAWSTVFDPIISHLQNIRTGCASNVTPNAGENDVPARLASDLLWLRVVLHGYILRKLFSKPEKATKAMHILYIRPRLVRFVRYKGCLFVDDRFIICANNKCDILCSAHIGWMQTARDELTRILLDQVAIICLEYIYPWYAEASSLISARSQMGKRKHDD
jgi:hypothetical protein